jgi:hypothetical protein
MDSVSSSTFGTTSQGNYTGTPTADSQEVDINLNTQLVKTGLNMPPIITPCQTMV